MTKEDVLYIFFALSFLTCGLNPLYVKTAIASAYIWLKAFYK